MAMIQFGKHRGKDFSNIPEAYLSWMIKESAQQSEDAKIELKHRANNNIPPIEEVFLQINDAAIDQASIHCYGHYLNTRIDKKEGICRWLNRKFEDALSYGEVIDGKIFYENIVFVLGKDTKNDTWYDLTTLYLDLRATKDKPNAT